MSGFETLNRKARRRNQAIARNKPQKSSQGSVKRLVFHSAIAVSASGLGYSRQAYAGSCTATAPDTYLCSGPASPTGTDSGLFISRGNSTVVTSTTDFGFDNSNASSPADALAVYGDGLISISVSGFVTGNRDGIHAMHDGSSDGALTVTTSGSVTGVGGDGIYARTFENPGGSPDTNLTITAEDATGLYAGIYTRNGGTGDLSINATGLVQGGAEGIYARNDSTGDVSITSSGGVLGGSDGIRARNSGTGGLTIDAAEVAGTSREGIYARISNTGATGDLSVTTSEAVSGNINGINARNDGTGGITIEAAAVTGTGNDGIIARISNAASADELSIATTGAVSGGSRGINARNDGTGGLTIEAAEVTGSSRDGIYARITNLAATGDLSVTTSGHVIGAEDGINVYNRGTGGVSVHATAVTGTNGHGIFARVRDFDATGDLEQPHLTGPICLLVHDRPVIHRDDGFGRWRAIAQCTVGAFCVVVFPPLFDQNLSFSKAVEDFAVEHLVSEPAIEAFTVTVLPRAPRFDVSCLGANGVDPVSDSLGDKFRPVI